jgi:hypothetical protein
MKLRAAEGCLVVDVDEQQVDSIQMEGSLNGPIALEIGPTSMAWFDELHVRSVGIAGGMPSASSVGNVNPPRKTD